jgi:bifunctional DNA-binding transcriptional regulator/antitoxin component of YhaV-PrlF toxin-antitoxin module
MIVTIDSKRRLTLPAGLISVEAGEHFDVLFDAEEDAVIFRRLPKQADWLDVLAECPISMDDIPPRRKDLPKRKKL